MLKKLTITVDSDSQNVADVQHVMTMIVPEDAAAIFPGVLLKTEGESAERYSERTALMDRLFAVADTG